MNRKEFIRNTGLAAASLTMPSLLFAGSKQQKVRIGLVGVGLRGQNHLDLLLRRADVDVVAICDIDDRMLKSSKEMITKSGKTMPQVFTGDPYAWKKMYEMKGLDGIVIATPWEWHKPMIIGAAEAGIRYIGTEVVLGITLEDHWDVVKASERHSAHVMMLENV